MSIRLCVFVGMRAQEFICVTWCKGGVCMSDVYVGVCTDVRCRLTYIDIPLRNKKKLWEYTGKYNATYI